MREEGGGHAKRLENKGNSYLGVGFTLAKILHNIFLSLDKHPDYHLRFWQTQPKICHSPKVKDGVENFFFLFLDPYFCTIFVDKL